MAIGKKRKRIVGKNPSLYYGANAHKRVILLNWKIIFNIIKYLLLIVLIGYITIYSDVFKIKDIVVSGNLTVDSQRIIELIPKDSNLFFTDSSKIEQKIMTNIPEINSLKIYKGLPNAIKIGIQENIPALLWISNGEEYLISDQGLAYKKVTNDSSQYNDLPRITDNKNISYNVPHRIVTSNYVSFIQYIFKNIYSETNIEPDTFYINETTVDLFLKTKSGIYIKFDSLRSPSQQLKNLKMVIMEKRPEILEYVDLRINGWAYFK